MTRVFASISVISFLLAAGLILSGTPSGGVALVVRAFHPPDAAPIAAPQTCSGVVVTGAHSGCLVFTQITCRPQSSAGNEDQVIAEGLLPGTSRAAVQVTPSQTRLAVTVFGATVTLFGGPPKSFDYQKGAELDAEVGQPGTPAAAHLRGWVSCGL